MKDQTSVNASLPNDSLAGRKSFIQTRAQNFGLTLVVMSISFALYYLGLFGSQDGPLNPERMGGALGDIGFTSRHLLAVVAILLVVALTWNHIYNLISRWRGRRMTCIAVSGLSKKICGAPTQRNAGAYVCPHGHTHQHAQFQPLSKGVWGHCAWITCGLFVLITLNSL